MKNKPVGGTGKNKNKKIFFVFRLIFALLFFIVAVFLFYIKAFAEEKNTNYEKLIITEIMYDPEGTNSASSDWIEIYNPTSEKIILEKDNFGIIDEEELKPSSDGSKYLNCHKISDDIGIESEGFSVIAENKSKFEDIYSNAGKVIDSVFSLSSEGDYIRLSNDRCISFFYEMSYKNSWGAKNNGRTLEKISFKEDDAKDNWQESYKAGGTPGQLNSKKPDPKDYAFKISINELFPAPNKGEDEYIELLNKEKENIVLSGWTFKDSSKNGGYVFPDKTKISAQDYLVVYKKDFKFALNNSGDESVSLINPAGVEISRIDYKGSKKGFSHSFDGSSWRWTSRPTPGKKNEFDKILSGKIKKDDEIYVDIYANFKVSADKDAKKFTWDFGDNHKSYLKKTKHKYEKTGTYEASLKITGDGEDIIYNFTIKVEKYKASKIRIIGISPNPKGNDTENEWIEIQNKSKKKIKLKGWSIATGWKNLYNHPIREDFNLKAGKTKKLTRDICAFTLANTKTKIELRDPTGHVVHRIKYNREENKIEEDEIYEKVDDNWEWTGGIESIINVKVDKSSQNIETVLVTESVIKKETPVGLGKYSINPAWQEKKNYQIELASSTSKIKMPLEILQKQGQVLGAEDIKIFKNYYSITKPSSQKHWAINFIKNIWMELNLFINLFLLSF